MLLVSLHTILHENERTVVNLHFSARESSDKGNQTEKHSIIGKSLVNWTAKCHNPDSYIKVICWNFTSELVFSLIWNRVSEYIVVSLKNWKPSVPGRCSFWSPENLNRFLQIKPRQDTYELSCRNKVSSAFWLSSFRRIVPNCYNPLKFFGMHSCCFV